MYTKGKSLLKFSDDYVVVDVETTGLDPEYDEIIEIGAIKVVNNEEVDRFQSFIKIDYPLPKFITELTGITDEMLKNAPSHDEVMANFKDFIGDSIIVAHNANFDIKFLKISNNFIDTLRIARQNYIPTENKKLGTLAKYFNIVNEDAHRSLGDCETTKKLYDCLRNYKPPKSDPVIEKPVEPSFIGKVENVEQPPVQKNSRTKTWFWVCFVISIIYAIAIIPSLIGGDYEVVGTSIVMCIVFIPLSVHFWKKMKKEEPQSIKEPTIVEEPKTYDIRTADGMLDYAKTNGYFTGYNFWQKNHFKVLEKNLLQDEIPIICFCGTIGKSGFYAFAITNKRIIYGQDAVVGATFKSVLLENFNDLTKSSGIALATISFDFYKEIINVGVNNAIADKLFPVLSEHFHNLKLKTAEPATDIYDDLRKLKSLLDDGIITQEEFDKKKAEILK